MANELTGNSNFENAVNVFANAFAGTLNSTVQEGELVAA